MPRIQVALASTLQAAISLNFGYQAEDAGVSCAQQKNEITANELGHRHLQWDQLNTIPVITRDDGIWIAIDQAFATPVGKDVEAREYVATQILAELFKAAGFDGIVYKSLLTDEGYNLALFDLADADLINCGLYCANSIRFDFRESGNTYFVGPKRVADESKSKG
jgi:hypothetical protein